MQFEQFLFPETISLIFVQSKVCMAPLHVRSKAFIAPIYVWSKFAPHMDGSNADFAPQIEGSQADFAPNMEQRHSYRTQIIAKFAIFAKFLKIFVLTTYILGVYLTYETTFQNKKYLEGEYL